jgi:hypothetical protein
MVAFLLPLHQVDSDPYVEPECPCGVSFCFKCGKDPHSPCTCKMWEMWEEKVNGDSETRNWLAANTKPCPKCTKPVEKNGGCNLVCVGFDTRGFPRCATRGLLWSALHACAWRVAALLLTPSAHHEPERSCTPLALTRCFASAGR